MNPIARALWLTLVLGFVGGVTTSLLVSAVVSRFPRQHRRTR